MKKTSEDDRVGSEFPFLSKVQIETTAVDLLMSYDDHLLKDPAAIPIEDIIENHLGISLEYQLLSDKDEDILGVTIFTSGKLPIYDFEAGCIVEKYIPAKSIIIDERLAQDSSREARFRFTCAHEAAHWHLHSHVYILREMQTSLFGQADKYVACAARDVDAKPRNYSNSWTERDRLEWQADYMASVLLMPTKTFKASYLEISQRLSKIYTDDTRHRLVIDEISKLFQVSKQAAHYRSKSLNLIHHNKNQELF